MDDAWMEQYKCWKTLEPYEIRLLEEGAKSLSQTWLLNSMWCEWKDMKKIKDTELPAVSSSDFIDPWEEKGKSNL